jgi:hypothetical protein
MAKKSVTFCSGIYEADNLKDDHVEFPLLAESSRWHRVASGRFWPKADIVYGAEVTEMMVILQETIRG